MCDLSQLDDYMDLLISHPLSFHCEADIIETESDEENDFTADNYSPLQPS